MSEDPKLTVDEALKRLADSSDPDHVWWTNLSRLTGLSEWELRGVVPASLRRWPRCKARVWESGDCDSCDERSVRLGLCQHHLDARITSLCKRREQLEKAMDGIDEELLVLSPFASP